MQPRLKIILVFYYLQGVFVQCTKGFTSRAGTQIMGELALPEGFEAVSGGR